MAAVRWWDIIRWFGFGWSPLEKWRDQERERECAIRLKNFAEIVKLILKSARGYILLFDFCFFQDCAGFRHGEQHSLVIKR